MLEFRLYFLDEEGRVTVAHEFVAPDESAAVSIAEAWREGRDMELWSADAPVRCWGSRRCTNPGCGNATAKPEGQR